MQAHEAVIDAFEGRTRKLDHVDLDLAPPQPFDQRRDQFVRPIVQEKRRVDHVDPERAERFLLGDRHVVEQLNVQDDLRRLRARSRLKANAQPAMAAGTIGAGSRRHGIGENEERGLLSPGSIETSQKEAVLVIEHRFQTLATDVMAGFTAPDLVADRGVMLRRLISPLWRRHGRRGKTSAPPHGTLRFRRRFQTGPTSSRLIARAFCSVFIVQSVHLKFRCCRRCLFTHGVTRRNNQGIYIVRHGRFPETD